MNRRDFLGSVACAFAAAAIPCRISAAAVVEPPAPPAPTVVGYYVDVATLDDGRAAWHPVRLYRFMADERCYRGDPVFIDRATGFIRRANRGDAIYGIVMNCREITECS